MSKFKYIYYLIKSIFRPYVIIDKSEFLSRGLFYNDDFNVSVRRASFSDIINYNKSVDSQDIIVLIQSIYDLVKNNTKFTNNYTLNDLKSIDLLYLFLKIVNMTRISDINIEFIDIDNNVKCIKLDMKKLYQMDVTDLMKYYDNDRKLFNIDDIDFTLPSLGLEKSIVSYLKDNKDVSSEDCNFIFFIKNRNSLTINEVDNLVTIFRDEISEQDKIKQQSIIEEFKLMQKYYIYCDVENTKVVELSSSIVFDDIW